MYDLKLKNFGPFKNEVEMKFYPLTYLIGANNSGKSTVIKALNLIENKGDFFAVDKYDIGGLKSTANNVKKPVEITYGVANDLYRKWTIRGFQDPSNKDYVFADKGFLVLEYLNEEGKKVLSTKRAPIGDSFIGIEIKLNFKLFYKVLRANNYEQDFYHLKAIAFPEKEVKHVIEAPNFMDEDLFESWFFNVALYDFFEMKALSDFIYEKKEFRDMVLDVFAPAFYLKQKLEGLIVENLTKMETHF